MKKYWQLCPWHFNNGRSFDLALFNDFRIKAQRWIDSMWLYVLLISLIGSVFVLTICLPRRKKTVKAMNLLGITDADAKQALENMKNGTFAYQPTDEERKNWLDYLHQNEVRLKQEKEANKPKVMTIWGIVLLASCFIWIVNGLSGNIETIEGENAVFELVLGAVMFAGGGATLLFAGQKLKAQRKSDAENDPPQA